MTVSDRQQPLKTVVTDYYWEGPPTQQAVIGCGACGKRQGFSGLGTDGALRAARRMGWQVEFKPLVAGGQSVPFIRCPDDRERDR